MPRGSTGEVTHAVVAYRKTRRLAAAAPRRSRGCRSRWGDEERRVGGRHPACEQEESSVRGWRAAQLLRLPLRRDRRQAGPEGREDLPLPRPPGRPGAAGTIETRPGERLSAPPRASRLQRNAGGRRERRTRAAGRVRAPRNARQARESLTGAAHRVQTDREPLKRKLTLAERVRGSRCAGNEFWRAESLSFRL